MKRNVCAQLGCRAPPPDLELRGALVLLVDEGADRKPLARSSIVAPQLWLRSHALWALFTSPYEVAGVEPLICGELAIAASIREVHYRKL